MTKLRNIIIRGILEEFSDVVDKPKSRELEKIFSNTSKEQLLKKAKKDLKTIATNCHPKINKIATDFYKYKRTDLVRNLRFFQRVDGNLSEIYEPNDLSDKTRKILEEQRYIESYLHFSHLDTAVIRFAHDMFNLPVPMMRAGSNLYRGSSKVLLPLMNAYQVDRNRISTKDEEFDPIYRFLFSMYEKFCAKISHETGCTRPGFFIWDGRTKTGDGTPRTNYLSEAPGVKRFKPSMFKNFVELDIEDPNLEIRVFPISHHNTVVSEAKEVVEGNFTASKDPKSILGATVERANRFPVYVVFNEPRKLSDHRKSKDANKATVQVANSIQNDLRDNIVIGPETLFSAVLYKVYHDMDYNGGNITPRDCIQKEFIRQAKYMKNNLIKQDLEYSLNNNSNDFRSYYRKMMQFCREDGRVTKDEKLNLPLIEFYYNQVKHLTIK